MTSLKTSAMLLGATALTLPLAFTPAAAQQQNQQGQQQAHQQQNSDMGACEQLYKLVKQSKAANEQLLDQFKRAPDVAEQNKADACALIIKKVDTAGGITAEAQKRKQGSRVQNDQAQNDQSQNDQAQTETKNFQAADTVKETVNIKQKALVEGQVRVRQPIPEVQVQQPSANIQVAERPVDVGIQQKPAEITIKQAPANVRVAIPRPTVTVEQPAPEITINMPPPGVTLDQQQPEVSVNMPDPKVTVSQADPDVNVDVQARFVDPDQYAQMQQQGKVPKVGTVTQRTNAAGEQVQGEDQADVKVQRSKPDVQFKQAENQGNVKYSQANPKVVYQPAEPNVDVSFADEPRVQVQQVGQPTVRILRNGQEQQANAQGEGQQGQGQQGQQQAKAQGQGQQGQSQQGQQQASTQGQGQQGQGQQQADAQGQQAGFAADVKAAGRNNQQGTARLSRDETNRLLGMQGGQQAGNGQLVGVAVADLDGRDVQTVRGEHVGEIKGIVRNGGKTYAVIKHGGFLGIGGDEIAVPASRIAVQGNDVVLLGLTEKQLEQMPNYDFNKDETIAGSDTVQIGRYQ